MLDLLHQRVRIHLSTNMNTDHVASDAIELLPVTGIERDQEHGGAAGSSYAQAPPHGAECEGNILVR